MKKYFRLNKVPLAFAVLASLSCSAFADEMMDTVVVTASRNEMPLERVGSTMTVITAEEIQQKGYSNLADLLRSTPGVAVSNAGGAGAASTIRIRGEEGYRTKILIDGMDVADTAGTQIEAQVAHISTQDIERIEVLRGPQGMMYGADAGGVVNVITKKASKPFSASLASEYGSFSTVNTSGAVSGKNDMGDYAVSFAQQNVGGFNAKSSDATLRDDDGYDNTTLNGKLGVNLTEKLRAQLTVRNVDATGEYDDCSDAFFTPSDNCGSEFRLNSQKADVIYTGDIFSHAFSYGETEQKREYFTEEVQQYFYDGDIKQGQYTGTAKVGSASTVVYGVDQKQERITGATYATAGERDQTGIFAEWQDRIGKQFFYTVGRRNDDNDDFGSHDTYRATAAWLQPVMSNELKYKASYGTGFRAPSVYEIGYNAGPVGPFMRLPGLRALSAETSEGFDAGVEFHSAEGLMLEAVYFHQNIDDAIDYASSGDPLWQDGYIQSSGTTRSEGVELSSEIPLADWMSILGNYTYNDTQDENDDQRVRRPRHYGSVGSRINIDKFSLLAAMRFSNDSENLIYGVGRVKLENYQVFDITAGYQVLPKLELYVRGQNIFDQEYEEVTGYNTAGAAVYGGFRFTY